MKKSNVSKSSIDQRRYLMDRLDTAYTTKYSDLRYHFKVVMPFNVKRAQEQIKRLQRIVRVHDNREHKIKDRLIARLQKEKNEVKQKILFGLPNHALLSVQSFEKIKYN